MMKLSEAGHNVWERPHHPVNPEIIGNSILAVSMDKSVPPDDKEGAIKLVKDAATGVPFGWVVAKDCMAGDDRVGQIGDGAELAIRKSIALCNKLAEEGL